MTVEMEKAALSYVLTLLARKRYTGAELEQKLKRRQYPQEIIDVVINYCKERKYIDDYEFAVLWIQDRIRFKPMGRWRIKQELAHKGIANSIIESALNDFLPVEQEVFLARELLSKYSSQKPVDKKAVAKIYNRLVRRGFSRQIIQQVAEEMGLTLGRNDQT